MFARHSQLLVMFAFWRYCLLVWLLCQGRDLPGINIYKYGIDSLSICICIYIHLPLWINYNIYNTHIFVHALYYSIIDQVSASFMPKRNRWIQDAPKDLPTKGGSTASVHPMQRYAMAGLDGTSGRNPLACLSTHGQIMANTCNFKYIQECLCILDVQIDSACCCSLIVWVCICSSVASLVFVYTCKDL